MAQAQFEYDTSPAPVLGCTVLASREWLRADLCADARAAGFRIDGSDALEGGQAGVSELVILDCPSGEPAMIEALSGTLRSVADRDGQALVLTTLDALDPVYAVLPHGDVPLLVDATRGERVIALGAIMPSLGGMGVRDLTEGDRLTLVRLTEQVTRLAERLDGLGEGDPSSTSAFRFNSPADGFNGAKGEDRSPKRSLPDPRLVRTIIRQRQLRGRHFGDDLFADPAWDMLLDLTAAHAEHERVSVTSLCIASGVPPTTALRWIAQMVDLGLLERVQDSADKRRAFIRLSERAVDAMAAYFAELAADEGAKVI